MLFVLTLLASFLAYWLGQTHSANRARERNQLQNQARVVEENLVRQLQGANSAISGVRYDLFYGDGDTNTANLPRRLQALSDAMPGVRNIVVTNKVGVVVGASRKDLLGRDFHARAYFAVPQAQQDYTTLYVSPPFVSVFNVYVVALSKAFADDQGRFAGVVFASLDPDYFDILMRSVIYAPDMSVSLAHGDGKEFLVAPPDNSAREQDLNVAGSLFRRHVDSGQASSDFIGLSPRYKDERMLAMRNILSPELRMNKPLTISVSRNLAAIDAPWRTNALASTGVFGLLCTGACAALGYVHNRRRALKLAHDAAQQALKETLRRFEFGLKGADLGLWDWDIAHDTLTINERQWNMLGYPIDAMPLKSEFWQSLIHPHDAAAVHAAFLNHAKGLASNYKLEHRLRHKDGHWLWVLSHAMVTERDAAGRATRILGTHMDISERKHADAELAAATALQLRTGEIAKIGGIQIELPTLQQTWTAEVFHIHDLPVGTPPAMQDMLDDYAPESRRALEAATGAAMQHGTPWTLELEMTTASGRHVWVRSQGEAVLQEGTPVRIMGTLQDITERIQFQAELQRANTQLEQLSMTDSLTGAGNRRNFDQSLLSEWTRSARQKRPLALLMVDIDYFKRYNDCYGHQGGDTCLREVAQILTACLRSGELLMRYGGEEFAILLPDTDTLGASFVAQRCLERIRHAGLPHAASPISDCISLSIGVASVVPGQNGSSENLVAVSDAALYEAKNKGRARYVCASPAALQLST
ncbi:MAG: diguanylate cyclase [Ferruginibacter sp.]|nr:diguanylate cyclase [Rhodoferax sp.]